MSHITTDTYTDVYEWSDTYHKHKTAVSAKRRAYLLQSIHTVHLTVAYHYICRVKTVITATNDANNRDNRNNIGRKKHSNNDRKEMQIEKEWERNSIAAHCRGKRTLRYFSGWLNMFSCIMLHYCNRPIQFHCSHTHTRRQSIVLLSTFEHYTWT